MRDQWEDVGFKGEMSEAWMRERINRALNLY